jgi:Sec-independent protein translocase protein TatA
MKHSKILLFRILFILLCSTPFVGTAQAQILQRGFGGAMSGALLGSLIGGRDGAQTGAAIGGAIGAIRGIDERARAQERQKAMARQEAERKRIREAQQQREIEELKRKQAQMSSSSSTYAPPSGAIGAPAGAGDSVTIVEIQKSLIRLGFDPGGVTGQVSPATTNAIQQYQAQKGLLETGQPSQALLTHMLRNGG